MDWRTAIFSGCFPFFFCKAITTCSDRKTKKGCMQDSFIVDRQLICSIVFALLEHPFFVLIPFFVSGCVWLY